MSWFVNHRPGATIGRHSLSHALAGVPAPSEREPGGCVPFIQPPRNRNVAGDFHRPYGGSEDFGFYHSTNDTPSVTPFGRDSSLREGAGNGLYHSPHRPKTATFRAIFIAPTKLKSFYIPPFIGSRAATHSRSISTVVTYISLQLAGMSSGVISRRGSPMYFFLCSTPW